MVLIVALAWIDTFYQNTQGIVAVRAQNFGTVLLKKEKAKYPNVRSKWF
jgi:hypothetical protein